MDPQVGRGFGLAGVAGDIRPGVGDDFQVDADLGEIALEQLRGLVGLFQLGLDMDGNGRSMGAPSALAWSQKALAFFRS